MKVIEIDGSRWKSEKDFYDSFLVAVGAPKWHGRNRDALWDSLTSGDINEIKAPFAVHIRGVSDIELRVFLHSVEDLFEEARIDGTDIRFTLE